MRTTLRLALFLSLASVSSAQFQLFKLTASDAAARDLFGSSVAVDGGRTLVGSPHDDPHPSDSGSAYLFDATTGQELLKLTPSDGLAGDEFGHDVDLSGDRAIVGAWWADDFGTSSGSAYLFDVTTGQELFKLTASDASSPDLFGCSVGVCGDDVIVGAYWGDGPSDYWGTAYLFDASTGQERFKLNASDGGGGQQFGWSVDIDGGRAAVGATLSPGVPSGAVYVFDVATGQELRKLQGSGNVTMSSMGASVHISGDRLITGAPEDGTFGAHIGAAYVFDLTTGQELFKLKPSDGEHLDNFGASVAISGNLALVGANGSDQFGDQTGSVYVFDVTTGQELAKLFPADLAGGDQLGVAVGMDGGWIAAGASHDDLPQLAEAGSVHVYRARLAGDIGTNYCGPAVPNWSGWSGEMWADGSDVVADNDVTVYAAHLPMNKVGYFLTSQTQGFIPTPGGSRGNLCLSGNLGRYRSSAQSSGLAGALYLDIDLTGMPTSPPGAVLVGETWNFTAWFRDLDPFHTSNFTDGISITFR